MNEQERSELNWLKRRQERLEQELSLLSRQLEALEFRLNRPEPEVPKPVEPPAPPATKLVEVVPRAEFPRAASGTKPPPIPLAVPPIIAPEPVLAARIAEPSETTPEPGIGAEGIGAGGPPPLWEAAASPPVAAPPLRQAKPAAEKSFEMRLGTYWLVRIGIVMVVTALVFFANLAYHTFIAKLGPGGKVTLLYLASGMLLGAGAWWQRKAAKESLKNYAQVLFAGGLAAVYFTTYAAHHIEQLKVIKGAGADGTLLLVWAGFMVWIADRKKSQVLALFAVLLAYYTAIISHDIGLFTLYSNLVLTLAAVFFLVRNRWALLSFASLGATYAAYAFWRFLHDSEWQFPNPEAGLWTGTYFLISYWVVFTAAVFLSKDEKFAGQNRASFLTLNNGAFFTLFLLTMWQVHHHGFWKFSLIYGIALLGLAELARAVLASEPGARDSYLTQGLLLGTIGIISNPHLAGLNLALILAAESVTLLMAGQQRKNWIMLGGAYVTAGLAVGWGMDGMLQHEPRGLWLGMGLGAVMLGNTLLADRETRDATKHLFRPRVSYFTVLALVIWFVATYNNAERLNFPLVLAVEAAMLILSIYLLQVREISLLSQGYLALAQIIWLFDAFSATLSPPWWSPCLMILLALGLAQWWQKQKVLDLRSTDSGSRLLNKLPLIGKNLVLFGGTLFAVRFAGGWARGDVTQPGPTEVYLPMFIGALMLADTLLAHRRTAASAAGLRLQPSYSTTLALLTWLVVTWHQTARETFPLVLAAEGLLLTFSYYLLRVREVSLLSQSYLLLAQVVWLIQALAEGISPPWWNPALLIAVTLVLSHWWQKQKVLSLPSYLGRWWQGVYALAIVGVIYYWLSPHVAATNWLGLTSLLGIGITAYGVLTRAWFLAAFGQIFLVVSAAQFVWQLAEGKPGWHLPLAPIAALGLLSYATVKWFERKPDPSQRVSQPLLQIALLYRWVALVMSIWWVCKYIPERERIWVFMLLGLAVFCVAGWLRNREALLFSAAFALTGLAIFWLPMEEAPKVYVPNLLALLVLLGQQALAKRRPERFLLDTPAQGWTIVLGSLSLWRLLSLWIEQIEQQAGGVVSYQTAGWSALALVFFVVAFVLHERVYRWLGLAVLACALGRVTVIDVWKLKTIYRVLSFMALGVVLLVLGFLYNKYQEKIREWL